jgi:hypothetical protein
MRSMEEGDGSVDVVCIGFIVMMTWLLVLCLTGVLMCSIVSRWDLDHGATEGACKVRLCFSGPFGPATFLVSS